MYWDWKFGGIILGLTFVFAVALVKPIGVSTQFVILDGLIASMFDAELVSEDSESKTGYSSSNAYLNKSGGRYAKSISNPINYGFFFVLSMILGGFLGRQQTNSKVSRYPEQLPDFHQNRFGSSRALRYCLAFFGGILVLWGARMAGGCTSGHMMSGMMQTAVSGYLFAMAAFAAAVPIAIFLYKRQD